MDHDWLLVETLGVEPAVVAQGQSTKNLVPISAYLRRHPHLMAIQTAIADTVQSEQPLSSITSKNDRVIRTEVVQMTDGRIHGVHVWCGPVGEEPPDRILPGPHKWDLTRGVAVDTVESLYNGGRNPSAETAHARPFADDLPPRGLNPDEKELLTVTMRPAPGRSFCSNWNVTDFRDRPVTVGLVVRMLAEPDDDRGPDHLICRAMNWRSVNDRSTLTSLDLDQLPISERPQPGVHRALVDVRTWRLIRWLDEPAPFYDWAFNEGGVSFIHPEDVAAMTFMTEDSETSPSASRVLRLRGADDTWVPVYVTVHLLELGDGTPAGLLSVRQPTEVERADAAARKPPNARAAKKIRKERKKAARTEAKQAQETQDALDAQEARDAQEAPDAPT